MTTTYEEMMEIVHADASKHFEKTQEPFKKQYEIEEQIKMYIKITYAEHVRWERRNATIH